MTKVRVAGFSISLDGFGAGPQQSLENPLGKRGLELHQWFFGTRTFQAMFGKGGGSDGVDEAHAHRSVSTEKRVRDARLQGIAVADKGANLLARRVVVQREAQIPITTSRPTVVEPLQTPKSTDAGGAAADSFPRCGPGRPCCRRRWFRPAGGHGCRLPASSQLQRQSALALRGYLAASVPSPCFARVRTWHGMPLRRHRSMGSL